MSDGLIDLQPKIVLISIFSIIVGGILTILRYIVFYYKKDTLKRSIINVTSTLLVLLILISNAQLSVFYVSVEGLNMYLDVQGIFILLIISWLLVVFKTIYETFEANLYSTKMRKSGLKRISTRRLIKYPNCKYMCRKEWKKCPICKSTLFKKK